METFSNSCSINKVSCTKTTHHVRVQITDSYDDLRKKRYFSKYLRLYGKSIQVRQLMIRSFSQISMMIHTPNVIWYIKEPKMSMQLTCSSFWGVFAFAESFTESLSTVHQFDTERRENPPHLLTSRLAGYSDRDAYQHTFPGIHS